MSKGSNKTEEIKVFLLFLLDDRRSRIRKAQKLADITAKDLEHWLKVLYSMQKITPKVFYLNHHIL
jgi:hypothetical protein